MNTCNTPRVLLVNPALAPYRVDFFNAIAQLCGLRLVFLNENLRSQHFDQVRLRQSLSADHVILTKGSDLFGRNVRFGLAKEIRAFSPDVVVTPEFSVTTCVVAAFRVFRREFAHVVLTDDNTRMLQSGGPVRHAARRLLLSRLDGLVVCSFDVREWYTRRLRFTGPVGVSPILHQEELMAERLRVARTTARNMAEKHRLAGKHVILYVGRLVPEKRVDRLIDAFWLIHRKRKDVVLVVVGDGPLRQPLQEQAHTLGLADQTIFAGRLEGAALHAWYCCGSVFALASDRDPWGAVINEALVAGMPVVCSNRAGGHVMIENGVNGSVVDPTNISSLAAEIEAWLDRTDPISATSFDKPKSSLMRLRFQDSVDGFMYAVNAAYQEARVS